MKNKYRAVKTQVLGQTFDSKKEAKRYQELFVLWAADEIEDLELQPKYRIEIGGVKICDYRADFRYKHDGETVVEDVKGFKTPVYRLKKKLMLAVYGINIIEI